MTITGLLWKMYMFEVDEAKHDPDSTNPTTTTPSWNGCTMALVKMGTFSDQKDIEKLVKSLQIVHTWAKTYYVWGIEKDVLGK